MTCLEHYFENLLFYGCDIKGELNKKALSKIEQEKVSCELRDYSDPAKVPCEKNWLDWLKEEAKE